MKYDIKYIILQTKYRKLHNGKDNIFPDEWYSIKEYELKKKILEECINKNCLITENNYYLEFRKIALAKKAVDLFC